MKLNTKHYRLMRQSRPTTYKEIFDVSISASLSSFLFSSPIHVFMLDKAIVLVLKLGLYLNPTNFYREPTYKEKQAQSPEFTACMPLNVVLWLSSKTTIKLEYMQHISTFIARLRLRALIKVDAPANRINNWKRLQRNWWAIR